MLGPYVSKLLSLIKHIYFLTLINLLTLFRLGFFGNSEPGGGGHKMPPPIDVEKYSHFCDETWHVYSTSLA